MIESDPEGRKENQLREGEKKALNVVTIYREVWFMES